MSLVIDIGWDYVFNMVIRFDRHQKFTCRTTILDRHLKRRFQFTQTDLCRKAAATYNNFNFKPNWLAICYHFCQARRGGARFLKTTASRALSTRCHASCAFAAGDRTSGIAASLPRKRPAVREDAVGVPHATEQGGRPSIIDAI